MVYDNILQQGKYSCISIGGLPFNKFGMFTSSGIETFKSDRRNARHTSDPREIGMKGCVVLRGAISI